MAIWKLPIVLADGTRTRVALGSDGEIRIIDSDGSSIVVVANDPDDLPPTGVPYVVDSDGSTRIPLAYERSWHSMDMTTIARVKALMGGNITSASDANLTEIVEDVSSRFERYMRRQVLKQTNTETYPLRRYGSVLSLKATPVTSITSLKYTTHPSDFPDTTAMDAGLYVLENEESGLVRFVGQMPFSSARVPGYIQAIYVGGMADDTADFIASWPDIARAADQQCAEEFRRRNTPGGNVQSDGGTTQYNGQLDLLEGVRRTLDGYRRFA